MDKGENTIKYVSFSHSPNKLFAHFVIFRRRAFSQLIFSRRRAQNKIQFPCIFRPRKVCCMRCVRTRYAPVKPSQATPLHALGVMLCTHICFPTQKPTEVAAHEKWNEVSRRRHHRRHCHQCRYDIVEKIIYGEAAMRACSRTRNLSVELYVVCLLGIK